MTFSDELKAYPFPGMFLANFKVGLTNVSPSTQAPSSLSSTDYTLCFNYTGTVPDGATVNLTCETPYPTGMFLFIIRRVSIDNMQLCEVEVYAHVPRNYFKQHNVVLMQEFIAVCVYLVGQLTGLSMLG